MNLIQTTLDISHPRPRKKETLQTNFSGPLSSERLNQLTGIFKFIVSGIHEQSSEEVGPCKVIHCFLVVSDCTGNYLSVQMVMKGLVVGIKPKRAQNSILMMFYKDPTKKFLILIFWKKIICYNII